MADPSHIEAIENEFKQIEDNKSWNQIYQQVKNESNYDLECKEARSSFNRPLNRYRDVLPYDETRIILENTENSYINASLLKVESIDRNYILTQGPLSITTPHFWLMVWQQKCKAIVMLNKIIEKNQVKCDQYWPLGKQSGGEDKISYSSLNLQIELTSETRHSHYIYRTFKLTNTKVNESRKILHFHYTTWPDFGVPQSPEAFYKFLSIVRSSGCLDSDAGPAVIHCSAGIGRSGTFCLVDSVLLMLSRGLCDSEDGKVISVLLEMRKFRMGLIQTPDQLRFSYQAIVFGAHRLNETNGRNPSEESSSEEPSSSDEPPPPPPPRTDSLTRSIINDSDADTETEEIIPDDVEVKNGILDQGHYLGKGPTAPPHRPLPTPPGGVGSSIESSPVTTPGDHGTTMQAELRRRKHKDRDTAIATKVQTIKEKQRAADDWEERKRLIFRPLAYCAAFLILGIGGGTLAYRYYYYIFQA